MANKAVRIIERVSLPPVSQPKLHHARFIESISQLWKKHNASQFWVFGVHAGGLSHNTQVKNGNR